jgi:ribosomal-protein-alanine N-acetyltransferase
LQTTFMLRQFAPGDLDQVINVNRVCLPENYSSYFFMEIYKKYPATFIVAEQDRALVGYIMCRIETGFSSLSRLGISKKGHVVSVAVLPQHQRRGVGTALLNEALKNMCMYKAKECFLEVRVSNTSAIGMYTKLGFQVARTASSYYADGEDALVMAKRLPRHGT